MPDDEIASLAQAISGEPPVIEEKPGGEVATRGEPKTTSQEKKETDASQEEPKDKPKVEDKKDEQEPPEDKPPEEDPLKGLKLRALLDHPELGPQLQEWADTGAVAQVRSALERQRPQIAADAKQQAEDRHWDEHFKEMSPEAVHEEIARDPKAAAAYAQYQVRQQSSQAMSPEAVKEASQLHAYGIQVATYNQLLEESDLPKEVKEKLGAGNFTEMGGAPTGIQGIVAWGNAIYGALIDAEAAKLVEAKLEERWEAYRQEHLAEIDGDRPPMSRGRKASLLPDLMDTPSEVLMEKALTQPEEKK